jgi:hypothetical protein
MTVAYSHAWHLWSDRWWCYFSLLVFQVFQAAGFQPSIDSLINAPAALNRADSTEKQGILGKLQHKVAEELAPANLIE